MIELGELGHEPSPEPAVRSRGLRRGRRALLAVAVLAAVLATAAAAVPAPEPLPRVVVPARLAANLRVAGDIVLVGEPSSLAMPAPELAAYRLPSAEPLWQVPWRFQGQLGSMQKFGDTLVVDVVGDLPGGVLGLDVADGRERWQQPGYLLATTASRQVLVVTTSDPVQVDPTTGQSVPGPEPTNTIRLVDPRTGAVRWARSEVRNSGFAFVGDDRAVGTLVLFPVAGGIELIAADTGRTIATGTRPGPDAGRISSSLVRGDLVLVTTEQGQSSAHRLPSLDLVWSRPPEAIGPAYLLDCGTIVCLATQNGDFYPVDLATGGVGARIMTDRSSVWRWGDKLLAETGGRTEGGLTLVDGTTGTELARFGPWRPLDLEPDPDRALVVRYGTNGRMFVGQVNAEARRIDVVAVLTDVSGDCQLDGDLLSCRLLDGSFGLWRLPR